jgi:hypothetical protein
MPLVHERDDINRRVVVTVTGPYHAADVFAFLARQRDDGTWTYGLLYDARSMTGYPTIDDLRLFMKLHAGTDVERCPRGPLAVLSSDPNVYAMACMCAALGGTTRPVAVFRTLHEADSWLAAQIRVSVKAPELMP